MWIIFVISAGSMWGAIFMHSQLSKLKPALDKTAHDIVYLGDLLIFSISACTLVFAALFLVIQTFGDLPPLF